MNTENISGEYRLYSCSGNNGFTLIEIMITSAVIIILSVISTPVISNISSNIRVRSDARELYTDLQRAKIEAVKRNSCVSVSFNTVNYPTPGGGYITFLDDGSGGGTSCDGTQQAGESTLATTTITSKNVSLLSANIGGTNSVCFTSKSFVCGSQMGNVQLRGGPSKWYKVTILAAGGMRLETSSDGTDNSWKN